VSVTVGNNSISGKYARLPGSYVFKPKAIELLGSLGESALKLFLDFGRSITSATGGDREGPFLIQRLPVSLQRLRRSFVESGEPDL